MSKLLNHRIYIIIIAIGVLLAAIFFIRSQMYNKEIIARVTPMDIELGMPVAYADSTKGAHKWLWEFGNGDTSSEKNGEYYFPETGKYQIRLTVNDNLEKRFLVNIRAPKKEEAPELVKIIAPEEALQGEYITFRGEGPSKEWRWEFGETGDVDAMEKTAIYKYELAGRYTVSLRTEDTQYPVIHTIEILPQYTEADTEDVSSIIANDIKEKLQAIIDQKPFNKNYNHILTSYLCNNPNTMVIINNDKRNDFYSYCQGLKIIGKQSTIIEKVVIDIEDTDTCIKKLIIVQTDF
ncbi:PKD domain-containing protein [Prevotella sp. 10(H)]|uniref:PKD domain-containing protein n=1 Tax=Prevotella sp. 10(H) TaxID=1158294 RepID=UPI0004A6E891|nr:PKD domain-containing protein [Prevotella sp. 10(H)]